MKRDRSTREFQVMVTLGESITAGGWSTCRQRCWASVLAALISDFQSTPVELHNAGVGANVISRHSAAYPHSSKPAGNERLDRDVIAHNPDLLIISYGLNDARGGTPVTVFREELEDMISCVQSRINPLIVLLGPYYIKDFGLDGEAWSHATPHLLEQYNKKVAEVASQKDCLHVDLLAALDATDWMIHYDGIHANDLGHRIVANRVFEVLAQNCSCLARRTKELEKNSPRWRDESCFIRDC